MQKIFSSQRDFKEQAKKLMNLNKHTRIIKTIFNRKITFL